MDKRSLSVSEESESAGAACYETLDAGSSGIPPQPGTSPYEVPILDLIVKGTPLHQFYLIDDSLINHCYYNIAILDSWDVLSKPPSRLIIALEDKGQEFNGWLGSGLVCRDMDGPLYSEVLRMGLDGEWEERNRKDGERRSIS